MKRSIVTVAVLAGLAAPVSAQDLNCRGVLLIDHPPTVVTLDIVRRDGEVTMRHARVGDAPIVHARPAITDNVLTFTLDSVNATFAMPVLRGPGVVRSAWTQAGERHAVQLNCRPTVPVGDSAAHTVRYVTVQRGVQLEVLDFGGTGTPLILLHGMSATAHDFDNFGPKLAREYRVIAITRRGFGRSSVPDTGYSADRLADDVLAIADSFHMVKPVLAGHSLGGADLSAVAARAPKSVSGLIYLDAGYPYSYVDSSRVPGFETKPEDMLKCPCSPLEHMQNGSRLYTRIPVPVLAIYAVDPAWEEPTYSSAAPWSKGQQAREFEKGVPTAHVVRIPNATHYVFESNPEDVLREMRAFVAGLRTQR